MRPTSSRWGAAALVAIAAVALLAAPSVAPRDSGTRQLLSDDHIAVEIPFETDSAISIDISYDVTVTAGPAVDVYFMDQASYDMFVSRAFDELSYYAAHTYLDTRKAVDSFTWYEKGMYYVVVLGKGAQPGDVSTVVYEVEWEETALGGSTCFVLGVVISIIVLVAIVAAFVMARKTKATSVQSGRPPAPAKPPPPVMVQRGQATAPQPQAPPAAPVTDMVPAPWPDLAAPEQVAAAAPGEGALPEPVYAAPAAYKIDRPKAP